MDFSLRTKVLADRRPDLSVSELIRFELAQREARSVPDALSWAQTALSELRRELTAAKLAARAPTHATPRGGNQASQAVLEARWKERRAAYELSLTNRSIAGGRRYGQ